MGNRVSQILDYDYSAIWPVILLLSIDLPAARCFEGSPISIHERYFENRPWVQKPALQLAVTVDGRWLKDNMEKSLREKPTMKTLWNILQPSRLKTVFFVIFTLLASTVTTGFEATSKVTWHVNRGIPFPFIILYENVPMERCLINTICVETNIQHFYLYALLFDVLVWYLLSCAIVFGHEVLQNQRRL
jgi:hypothetical protein